MNDAVDNRSSMALVTTNCSSMRDEASSRVSLYSVEFILPMTVLVVFNVIVIVGNSLVIIAVFTHTKLRTATNMFIVSLAVADLLLGLMVLPFSSANEVTKGYWPFGYIWCRIWLAVDVLLCTASILNLCAISLDRYLAISRPFKYPRLMSPRRAKILVGVVWLVAFVICFPPLVGWNERGKSLDIQGDVLVSGNSSSNIRGNVYPTPSSNIMSLHLSNASFDSDFRTKDSYRILDGLTEVVPPCPRVNECHLEADSGYRIYSAFGSFWVPVWIMVFFYWRIYLTAARTTRALRRGVITKKVADLPNASTNDASVTLRVHRGGGCNSFKIDSSKRCPRDDDSSNNASKSPKHAHRKSSDTSLGRYLPDVTTRSPSATTRSPSATSHSSHTGHKNSHKKPPKIKITFCNKDKQNYGSSDQHRRASQTVSIESSLSSPSLGRHSPRLINGASNNNACEPSPNSPDEGSEHTRLNILHKGRCQVRSHLKRLNKEKKAAKTVGVIVGCFILCWAPFFTVYLVDAFCESCTPQLLFTVFFWLGYCNSAVNPCLYALCSNDFRYAFKKLLRCRCERLRHPRPKRHRILTLLNSVRIQMSSRGSDSNSD